MGGYEKLKIDMSRHFQASYPLEACGIITTDWNYVPCNNISPLPKDSFILDPVALLEHEEDTWAIVHSHPGDQNPIPSEDDIASTVFKEYKFIVGFADKFFIYWFDERLQILRYEPFEEQHLVNETSNTKIS